MNDKFVGHVREIKALLCELKADLDRFDAVHKELIERVEHLKGMKGKVFGYLNSQYVALWTIAKGFSSEEYSAHQKFILKELKPLLHYPEVNKHILEKPFGYPGDYVIMNYVYDHQGDKYLGKTSYEMILNNYACNMPTLKSNPVRLEYIISKIMEMMRPDGKLRVASIACGPARELLGILREGHVAGELDFTCFDLEPKALEYVKEKLSKIPEAEKKDVSVRFINRNILDIIRRQVLRDEIGEQGLIYAIGLYDYLNDNLAKKLSAALFSLLKPGGKLVLVNIALEPGIYRVYYEMMGGWNMFHRTKEEMLKWGEMLPHSKLYFEEPSGGGAYYYLVVEKQAK